MVAATNLNIGTKQNVDISKDANGKVIKKKFAHFCDFPPKKDMLTNDLVCEHVLLH
jgi:hypothetical protein